MNFSSSTNTNLPNFNLLSEILIYYDEFGIIVVWLLPCRLNSFEKECAYSS